MPFRLKGPDFFTDNLIGFIHVYKNKITLLYLTLTIIQQI